MRFGKSAPRLKTEDLKMVSAGDFRNGMTFEEDGNVVMETNADDDDIYYDEVSSGLLIAEIRRSRQELFESLSLYYRVFIKKEDVSELLDEEDGE